MNAYKIIAIIFVLIFINGIIATVYDNSIDPIGDLTTDYINPQKASVEVYAKDYKDASESVGIIDQMISTAGNAVKMGWSVIQVMFRGATAYNLYLDSNQNTVPERIIGLFMITITSMIMMLLTIMLIYDVIKNRKTS